MLKTEGQNDGSAARWKMGSGGAYWKALTQGLIYQMLLLAFAAVIFDGGFLFQSFAAATIPYWVMVLLIIGRRPRSPSKVDLAVIRFGFPPLALVMVVGLGMKL